MTDFFLPVRDFEGLYAVSQHGVVKSLSRVTSHGRRRSSNVMTQWTINGYVYVQMSRDGKIFNRRLSRLVAGSFLPPSDFPEVHHRNHDKSLNTPENLEWVSREKNMSEAARAGRLTASKNPRMAKRLTLAQTVEIRSLKEGGISSEEIGPLYGVSGRTIRHIWTDHTWKSPDEVTT